MIPLAIKLQEMNNNVIIASGEEHYRFSGVNYPDYLISAFRALNQVIPDSFLNIFHCSLKFLFFCTI